MKFKKVYLQRERNDYQGFAKTQQQTFRRCPGTGHLGKNAVPKNQGDGNLKKLKTEN